MKVTLKLATSLDGRIATASGESRWITGAPAREEVHRMRSRHDAILVGVGTVLADDPDLGVRLEGYDGPQPARVVLDSRARTPAASRLAQTARERPVWLFTLASPPEALTALGVRVVPVAEKAGRVDPGAVLAHLAESGVQSIMIEGGGEVAAGFLKAGLVDGLEWFRAPLVLGASGRPALGDLAVDRLAAAPRFRRISAEPLGEDLWERYERI
jgi:diaminohydroxyphosphoribosylaminopyrimidine deaminase / 5-amino-6-(5-phosphoribosylamino)uracil reductase